MALVIDPNAKYHLEKEKKDNQWIKDHLEYVLYSARLKDVSYAQKVKWIDGAMTVHDDVVI